jgi:hypothetical protein
VPSIKKQGKRVRFQVLKAASMKTTVFWDVAPCSLEENDRRFRMTEAVSISKTPVNFYETTRRNIPEKSQPSRAMTYAKSEKARFESDVFTK